jgi:dipeptidyl-peptidase-4
MITAIIILLVLTSQPHYWETEVTAETTTNNKSAIKINVEGWPVVIDVELNENVAEKEKALTALANHLQRIKYIVPENRVKELQQLPIWIDWKYKPLSNMQYHPSSVWLKNHGHDPRLAKHVHIPRAGQLTDRRQWAQHPYVILHELAHAYHDQVLGFNHPGIRAAFDSAKESQIYDEVLNHVGQKVRHYGLSNEKEYFAEMTEAYFGVNDFFPFVRAELKQHDPKMHSLLRKIWGEIE